VCSIQIILPLLDLSDFDPQEMEKYHFDWGSRFASQFQQFSTWDNLSDPQKKLTIGYLSPDFFTHSVCISPGFLLPFKAIYESVQVSYYIISVLLAYNRSSFRVICYSNVAIPDHKTEKIKSLVDEWRDVRSLDTNSVCSIHSPTVVAPTTTIFSFHS
jgi:predicted O-linked N-acetylglucosamine transferase (SPINDLY family)